MKFVHNIRQFLAVLQILHYFENVRSLTLASITNGHCQKNISVKYRAPVTRTRNNTTYHVADAEFNKNANLSSDNVVVEQYVAFEEHIRWDSIRVCCPGYRTIVFGLCEPICSVNCPAFSYCVEPEKCACVRGYAASHHTISKQQHQLLCRPNCMGGCPEHSQCAAHNQCKCRSGYRDVSHWFGPLHCEQWPCPEELHYDSILRKCVRFKANN